MISHILVATDLLPNTEIVLQKAKEIADKFNAKLSIIHVVEYLPPIYSNLELISPFEGEFLQAMEDNARADLTKLADKYNIAPTNRYLEVGMAKHSVLELATKLEVDLLVVGSHGRHSIDLLLGSTANAILHAAKCSVLAVRIP